MAAVKKKMRDSKGGAYTSRGKFFARVTIAPQARRSELLPWCASLADAEARASAMQSIVNRLRMADRFEFIDDKLLVLMATANETKMAEVLIMIDRIIAGEVKKIDGRKVKIKSSATKTIQNQRQIIGDLRAYIRALGG